MTDGIRIIAWFTPDTRDEPRVGGKVARVGYCRLCARRITEHLLVNEAASPEELAEAREAGHRDGETFFAHLQLAHPEQFGEEADNSAVNN